MKNLWKDRSGGLTGRTYVATRGRFVGQMLTVGDINVFASCLAGGSMHYWILAPNGERWTCNAELLVG